MRRTIAPAGQPETLAALALLLAIAGCGPFQFFFPATSHLSPSAAGPDYAVQGEYASATPPFGAQVIALGDGVFEAVLYRGGLPGAGWDGSPRVTAKGQRSKDGGIRFDGAMVLAGQGARLVGTGPAGETLDLSPVERESPTLGGVPPSGAIVIFDGTGTDEVQGAMDADGHLKAGAKSRAVFRDFDLHVEFRTPFTPKGRGQFRGNSGVYLQDRYEVQVLDSFGLPEKDNDCGGIYQVAVPEVNMSFPPLRWQTYDIEFRAARWDAVGNKTSPARVTVLHNGVRIHDDVEIGGPTGGGEPEEDTSGPIYLQDHWDPVVYRNVWVVPK